MRTPGTAERGDTVLKIRGLMKICLLNSKPSNQSAPGTREPPLLPPLPKQEVRGFLYGVTDQDRRTESQILIVTVPNERAQPTHLTVKSTS